MGGPRLILCFLLLSRIEHFNNPQCQHLNVEWTSQFHKSPPLNIGVGCNKKTKTMCFRRFVPPANVFGTPTENPQNKWVSIPWSDRIHPQTNKTMQRHQKTQIHLPPSIPSCRLQVLLPKGALPPLRTFQCVKMPVWFSTHALLASLLPGCHLFPLTNLTSLARETQLWWMHLWGSIHSRRSTSSRLTSFRWLFFQRQNNIPSSENGGWDASCGPLPDKPGHEKVCSVNHRSPRKLNYILDVVFAAGLTSFKLFQGRDGEAAGGNPWHHLSDLLVPGFSQRSVDPRRERKSNVCWMERIGDVKNLCRMGLKNLRIQRQWACSRQLSTLLRHWCSIITIIIITRVVSSLSF